jgi:hypothetical protein
MMSRVGTTLLSLFTVALLATSLCAQISVTSVSPEKNALHISASTDLRISFSSPVDPESLIGNTLLVFGQWSGVALGDVNVSENGTVVSFFPVHPFSSGEKVTVTVARTLLGLDGTMLGRGYTWQFWVASGRADITMVETDRIQVRRPDEGWIQTYGAYAGDLNGDGSTDFAVPNEQTNDVRVFLNNGQGDYGSFEVFPVPGGARPSTNEGADFNRDGHIDFVLGNSTGRDVSVFIGDGSGALTQGKAYQVGHGVRGLAVLDLNGDGFPDIATANRIESSVSTLLNDGTGAFLTSVSISTPAAGETAASAADMNEDGLLDLVIGSFESHDVQVLLADSKGGLVPHSRVGAGRGVWMIMTGDVNEDGHADVVTSNSGDNTVSVIFGDGAGGLLLSDSYASESFPLAVDLGDIDGDGDLDMVSSNFRNEDVGEGGSWIVFENLGNGFFSPASRFETSGAGSCAVLHDRNNDGALDMTAIDELQDLLVLFTNRPLPTSTELPEHLIESAGLRVFPNPFTNQVTVGVAAGPDVLVDLEIFDVAGRLVRKLDAYTPDSYEMRFHWNGRDSVGRELPPGSYLIRAKTGVGVVSEFLVRSSR